MGLIGSHAGHAIEMIAAQLVTGSAKKVGWGSDGLTNKESSIINVNSQTLTPIKGDIYITM